MSATCSRPARRSRCTPHTLYPAAPSASAVASPNPLLAPRINAHGSRWSTPDTAGDDSGPPNTLDGAVQAQAFHVLRREPQLAEDLVGMLAEERRWQPDRPGRCRKL